MVSAAQIIPLEIQIEALVKDIRVLHEQMEALENAVSARKSRLRALLVQRGSSWEDDQGYARIVADYTRTAYDAKALNELRLRSKWWDMRLRPYYREFTVKGSVQVR